MDAITDFTFADLTAALSLSSDPGMPYNIMLYLMLGLNLIAFFMQDDKQLITTLLVGLTMALIVIAKLDVISPINLGMLLINVGIFTIPLIVTGMSKAKKSKPLTIFAGVIGGVYFFSYWFFLQRGG